MGTKTKIFFTLFLTYAFFTNTYLTTNDASRFSLTASIVEEQTFKIDNYLEEVISDWWWPKDYATYNGRKYSDKAPLGSFLGVPIYFIIRFFSSDYGVLAYFVTLFTSGLLTAVTALLIYDIGKYFTENQNLRTGIALAYGLGTPALVYGTVFFSHAITTFFGFAAFYLLFILKKDQVKTKKLLISGAFVALAISSDYYAGIIAVVLLGYAFLINKKKFYPFLLSFMLTILLLLSYHTIAFGGPFSIPYSYANLYDDYHSTGFYGIRLPDSEFILNLASQLFSPWGFIFTTPLSIFSVKNFPKLWKSHRLESLTILAISIGLFIVAGSIGVFDGYSSRMLVALIPFMTIPLFYLDFNRNTIRIIFYFFIVGSFLINLAGVDTFLPNIADKGYIEETSGNHNIFGEWLLIKGVNIHYYTIAPLILVLFLIWIKEIIITVKAYNQRTDA